MTNPAPPKKTIHYIVVIHGIGEARQNETILSVASRCAEARFFPQPWAPPPIVVPLGSATSQTGVDYGDGSPASGLPWVEYADIPAIAQSFPSSPFYAQPNASGDNIRFVNIHWNDLISRDWVHVGQTTSDWVDGMLGRLIRKDRYGSRVPRWALETLRTLGESVSLVRKYTALRAKDFDDLAFNKYLGDVQLYGEYRGTRALAVRRFHDRMAQVESAHAKWNPNCAAQYTILAHSLGTVMAADALMLAHAPLEQHFGQAAIPELDPVLAGYMTAAEQASASTVGSPIHALLQCSWKDKVKSFVTLGSPIDKYLIIWWLNYQHWLRPDLFTRPGGQKIAHYNYCEEQDPVGHHLDVAYTAPGFVQIFEEKEDRVYTRFAIPGVAHVHYWNDLPLFKWILFNTIDGPAQEPEWFISSVYWWIVAIIYVILPLSIALAHTIALNWAWNATGLNGQLMGSMMFVFTWLLGRYIIDLMIWWRQVLKSKAKVAEGRGSNSLPPPPPPAGFAGAGQTPPKEPRKGEPPSPLPEGSKKADQAASPVDMLKTLGSSVELLKWAVDRNPLPPDVHQPVSSATASPPDKVEQRKRWDAEQKERQDVEQSFRGLLLFLHLAALLLVAVGTCWYFWCFAQWSDLLPLGIIGAFSAALVTAWIVTAHGDVVGADRSRRMNRFRVVSPKRLAANSSDTSALPAEGFLTLDILSGLCIAFPFAVGCTVGLLLRHAGYMLWEIDRYEVICTGFLLASLALAGVFGYTRFRLRRVKQLLAQDDNSPSLDFVQFSAPAPPPPST